MARVFSIDTMLAILGTIAASASVVINQQWLSETQDAITVLMEEQTDIRYQMVNVEDTKRESVRLRDLNTLYTLLHDLSEASGGGGMILDEAVRAYEIALISMAAFESADTFDSTTFKIENIATRARQGDMQAWRDMGGEFVRLYALVDRESVSLRERQKTLEREMTGLRNHAAQLSALATYCQVFGLILVMVATILGLKRIEFCLQ